jgi:glycosyltransferase involved in cell wall biosynthesis
MKKRVALWAYQRRDLETVSAFVATSELEAIGIREFGLSQPIAIIPNGIDLPPVAIDRPRVGNGPRIALFLGRIHPAKGLLNLIEVWARTKPRGWVLHIAGPDEGGHLQQVMRRVSEFNLTEVIKYIGSVSDSAKFEAYSRAELFILPTFSENFGVVVAEALSCALPVVTTKGAPWHALEEHQCGWWVEPSVAGLAEAVVDSTSRSPEELAVMGQRGRVLANQFRWPAIAKQMAAVYAWVLGCGAKPECIYAG